MKKIAGGLALLALLAIPFLAACTDSTPSNAAADGDTEASEAEVEAQADGDAENPATIGHLLIVTTEAIRKGSTKLSEFQAAREQQGYVVRIVTESEYGAKEAKGFERAKAIRSWLGAHQAEFPEPRYLLLIGDAHPQYGDVPMFVTWARYSYPADSCANSFAMDCRYAESDLPYGETAGNWDLNGNSQWGEHGLDDGPGCLRFESAWRLGRIPTYFGDTSELDHILALAIAYPRETAQERAYRQKILLPAAFYYFKGQALSGMTIPEDDDGAMIPEWFIANTLADHPEVKVTRLYEKEGLRKSTFACELPLTRENVIQSWGTDMGMVYWFGHGLQRAVYRTIWSDDENGDELPNGSDITQPPFLSSEDAPLIGAKHGAFVVAVSCEVGSVETPQNLSYALLLSGAAIGVVGSTSVTPGDTTFYKDLKAPLDTTTYGASNVGIYIFGRLLAGAKASQALIESRTVLGGSNSIESDAGRLMLNYYGDPTLGLLD